MRALVTGAAGFIGRNIMQRLREQGHSVIGIDPGFNSVDTWPRRQKQEYLAYDVRWDLKSLLVGADVVFHNAAITTEAEFCAYPEYGNVINVEGTFNLLKHCAANGVKRVIFSSSASVYGQQGHMTSEDMVSPSLGSLYALSKLFGEFYGRYFSLMKQVEVVSLRYFNVYGPMENKKYGESVVTKFLKNAKKKESPEIYGYGNQCRDFIYIDDVVKANLLAVKWGVPGQVYNVGSGTTTTFNGLWDIISDVTDFHGEPNFTKRIPDGYQVYTRSDNKRSSKELHFTPRVNLKDGIVKTFQSIP